MYLGNTVYRQFKESEIHAGKSMWSVMHQLWYGHSLSQKIIRKLQVTYFTLGFHDCFYVLFRPFK